MRGTCSLGQILFNFCIEIRRQCRSEFTSSRALSVSLLPLAFVFQASQSVPRFVSLLFRRLKIRLRYEPSFIRRVIRQLVYNIFRCNDDLTSTDLSLSLSFPFSLHAYRPLFYNRFSVSRNTDKCRFERGNESRKLFIYEMYKYMFSIDL